ncbi:hypothetical protein BE11_50140 [Sorangium cellulosum]|nr:hypothetical protein BE11_50140 [Sorangium cellulosum]
MARVMTIVPIRRAARVVCRFSAAALALLWGASVTLDLGGLPGRSAPAAVEGARPAVPVKQKTSETCTTILVGKGISESGRLLHAHNEDLWYDTAQNLLIQPALSVRPTAMEQFFNTRLPYGVTRTLAFLGSFNFNSADVPGDLGLGMNEAGVMITTNTAHARPEEIVEREAPLVYSDFLRLALERATTSIDAVRLIAEALERHGMSGDPGMMFFISDLREAWVLEATPVHWAAVRVPEDGYLARANQYGITDAGDIGSADLISDAIARGFYTPADPARPEEGFSFREAYGDPRWNDGVYADYNRPREQLIQGFIDERLAASGAVSTEDLMVILRSHLEGTAFEAVPPHSRAQAVDYTGDDVPRTVCTARTVVSIIGEQDASLPAGLAARWWTAFPAPCSTAYFPIYLSHVSAPFPQSYGNARADGVATPDRNAWWAHAELLSSVDKDHPRRQPVVRAAFDALEASVMEQAALAEQEAARLYAAGRPSAAADLLNGLTDDAALDTFRTALRLRAEVERMPRPRHQEHAPRR